MTTVEYPTFRPVPGPSRISRRENVLSLLYLVTLLGTAVLAGEGGPVWPMWVVWGPLLLGGAAVWLYYGVVLVFEAVRWAFKRPDG